jgi:hypothetical protein
MVLGQNVEKISPIGTKLQKVEFFQTVQVVG